MGARKGAVENVGVKLFADVYRGRRVVVTGHTGFKGSWLSLWLKEAGAEVTGISLDPETHPNHWELLNLDTRDHRQDIRDADRVQALLKGARPEIVFHLAAQPLVRRSYDEPIENWSTNVMGTAHVLEACRHIRGLKSIVAITTDKVYANQEWSWGYRETDRLGGHDPYSASKAACEILIESYRKAFFNQDISPLVASARAGNVIGGGDWAADRLIPDLVRSLGRKESLEIRSPHATRPWQHVLECVAGYLMLGQRMLQGDRDCGDVWNFGPSPDDNRTVAEVLGLLRRYWSDLSWNEGKESQPHEATRLYLDSAKARTLLGWEPIWNIEVGLQKTAEWYHQFYTHGIIASRAQLAEYVEAAGTAGACWVHV